MYFQMKISKEKEEKVIELYISGVKTDLICNIVKIDNTTVYRVLLDYNIPKRKKSKAQEYSMEEAFKLRREGFKTKDIAAQLGVSTRFLQRRGLNKQEVNSNCISVYKKNLQAFSTISNELEAYYLGLLYADGSVSNKNNSVRLELEISDGYIIIPLRDYICSELPIYTYTRDKKGRVLTTQTLSFKSKEIKDNLTLQGLFSNKSFADNLKLPNLDSTLMNHFIRGYFDGDGSVYFCEGLKVNFTGSFNFIQEIELYLKANKIITTIAKTRKKPHQSDSSFAFSSKLDMYNFYNFLYSNANYYLTRKKDKFLMHSMNCWENLKAS